jgi:hypothetical protein
MPYSGETLRIPTDSGGLNGGRNLEIIPPKACEFIRNFNLHEDGRGKRGGTSTLDTNSDSSRGTGLKQFKTKLGENYLLRATANGKYWSDSSTVIKSGLSVRGDEVLAEGDFATHAKWSVTGDFDDTGGNLDYTDNTNSGTATQTSANFQTAVRANRTYELAYTLATSGGVGDIAIDITTAIASTTTALTVSAGAQTTQFTTASSPGNFVLSGTSSSGDVNFTAISLKEVIAPPVDISVYNKKAILTNGRDVPQVFTGLRFLEVPAACVAGSAENGSGNVDNGKHLYKLTLVNSSGETTPSPASNEIDIADKTLDGQVSLTSISTGPSDVTSRKIYRTLAGGSVYWLLTTISDNVTTTFTDNIADATISGGTAIPTDNTATTGSTSTDLGVEGLDVPGALNAALVGAGTFTAQLAGSGSGVDVGTHSWMLTFKNEDGVHSTYGTKSNVVNVSGSAEDVDLSGLPLGPAGTIEREVYRTKAGDTGEYYEVGSINDNTTTTFTDNVSDANLGSDPLSNGVLTAGTDWTFGGDFLSAVNLARYTHSSGSGNLIQNPSNMIGTAENNHRYELMYDVVANDAPGNINAFKLLAGQLTDNDIDLDTTVANDKSVTFTTKETGFLVFNIAVISTGTVEMDIDNLRLLEIGDPGNPIDAGDHTYQVTFVNVHGETTGGTISNTITADALNGEVNLTNIPTGPIGVTARNIYRTAAGGSQQKLLVTLPDNTTTTYRDKITDANLGDNIPTTNTAAARPSDWLTTNQPKYALEHASGNAEGIIMFGLANNPDQIYVVDDGSEDFSDANVNVFTIESGRKVTLTGGIEYGTRPLIFSEDEAWIIDKTSLDISEWTYFKAPWTGGAASNRLLVKTDNDTYSMMADGTIYSISAAESFGDYLRASVSKPANIDRWIRTNINLDLIEDFHATYDPQLRCIKWFMVRTGEAQVGSALTFFVDKPVEEAWVVHDDEDNVDDSGYTASISTLYDIGPGTETIYTTDYLGVTWKLEQTAKNDNSNGYKATFKTSKLTAGNQRNNKKWDRGRLILGTTDTVSINVWGDDTLVERLGPEMLNDKSFDTGTPWDAVNGFTINLTSNKAVYTHDPSDGVLAQTVDNLAIDPTIYAGEIGRLTGTMSETGGNPTLKLLGSGNSGVASADTSMTVADGAISQDFTFASSPGWFRLLAESDSGDDILKIDDLALTTLETPTVGSDGRFEIKTIARQIQAEFFNNVANEDLFIKEVHFDFKVMGK